LREVVVEGTPDYCLERIEAYVVSELQNEAEVSRPTPSTFRVLSQRRTMVESFGGWLVLAALTVVTIGIFGALYLVYWLFVVGKIHEAKVTATKETGGRTRLLITSNNWQWEHGIESYIRRELKVSA
jgi:hypothetical protein